MALLCDSCLFFFAVESCLLLFFDSIFRFFFTLGIVVSVYSVYYGIIHVSIEAANDSFYHPRVPCNYYLRASATMTLWSLPGVTGARWSTVGPTGTVLAAPIIPARTAPKYT